MTITGTGFTGATAVKFGTTAATTFTVNSSTQITATAPAGTGTVDITVTTPAGTSTTSSADHYAYTPVVTAVSPGSGPATGSTAVTISGAGFTGATAVDFGNTPATNVVIVNDGTITADAPAGSTGGTVDVTVTGPTGTSPTNNSDQYAYIPVITELSPDFGPLAGEIPITISGAGFTSGSTVKFGNTTATVTAVSPTQITATEPPTSNGAELVYVTVTTPSGTSATGNVTEQFAYKSVPGVESVSPDSGSLAGGSTVTITGTAFTGAKYVYFGSTAATNVVLGTGANADSTITATVPPGAAGTVDVTVSGGPNDTSADSADDHYTYDPLPTVASVAPSAARPSAGPSVTITGSGFTNGTTTVSFGGMLATNVSVLSTTELTAVSPSGSAGTVDVTVSNPGRNFCDQQRGHVQLRPVPDRDERGSHVWTDWGRDERDDHRHRLHIGEHGRFRCEGRERCLRRVPNRDHCHVTVRQRHRQHHRRNTRRQLSDELGGHIQIHARPERNDQSSDRRRPRRAPRLTARST